ncbi:MULTISPECIES: cupin domain-containing protein [unclassified Burkholderia]|uniref:cupin domain-containing protein n=1 Tax=unclassified Burkholderia TaxID=2613784 RepID=UPI002ABD9483|nr:MULTISPECIES: cupin domain-containing protein [unclassified Burkholderia]
MNDSATTALTRADEAVWETRDGGAGGIAWAARSTGNSLASGFGRLKEGGTPPKTLDYDEVIHVLKGTFGITCDGKQMIARAGDVLSLSRGSVVTYSGQDAEFFFVVTAI